MRRSVSVQIFTKGSVHAVVRLGKSTFTTRAVRAATTVAWQETGMLYVRCGSLLTHGSAPSLLPIGVPGEALTVGSSAAIAHRPYAVWREV